MKNRHTFETRKIVTLLALVGMACATFIHASTVQTDSYTWQSVYPPENQVMTTRAQTYGIEEIVVDRVNGYVYALGVGPDEGTDARALRVWRSSDDGNSWKLVWKVYNDKSGTDPWYNNIGVDSVGNVYLVGAIEVFSSTGSIQAREWAVWRSEVGGEAFVEVDTFRPSGYVSGDWYNLEALWFASDSQGRVYVGGDGDRIVSGGTTKTWIVREYSPEGGWMVSDEWAIDADTWLQDVEVVWDDQGNEVVIAVGSTSGTKRGADDNPWVVRRKAKGADEWRLVDEFQLEPGQWSGAYTVTGDLQGNVYVIGRGERSIDNQTTVGKGVVRTSAMGGALGTWATSAETAEVPRSRAEATIGSEGKLIVASNFYDGGNEADWWVVEFDFDLGQCHLIDDFDSPLGGESVRSVTVNSSGQILLCGYEGDPSAEIWGLIRIGSNGPVANAGSDQEISDTDGDGWEAITLDGSTSSPAGEITYAWDVESDGTVDASEATIDVAYPSGSWIASLTVTDGAGLADTDTVTVTVLENQGPMADAGPNQLLVDAEGDGQWVTLDGSNSIDDGMLSYAWDFESDGVIDSTQATVNHFYGAGAWLASLTVTDEAGLAHSDSAEIVVSQPPVADAGTDQTLQDSDGDGKQTVSFDGTASFDPDGSIAFHAWDLDGDGSTELTGAQPSETLATGSYTVTLTVTDDVGLIARDWVNVTIRGDMHVGDLDGSSTSQGKSWTAAVTVTIHDPNELLVEGAEVTGKWSDGTPASGTTSTAGTVSFKLSSIPKKTSSVRLEITGVTHSNLDYIAADNHDPDGESDGTRIIVNKP